MQLTYEDLSKCKSLARLVESKGETILRLRATMERVTPRYTETPSKGGPATDHLAESMAQLEELEASYFEERSAFMDHVMIVEEAISAVADPAQQQILRLRYIDGLVWDDIASRVGYEERQCRRIHTTALSTLGIEDVRECPTQMTYYDNMAEPGRRLPYCL